MEKLMKNWIFTLVICILLSILAVLMILGALDVKGVNYAKQVLHLIAAVILVLYTIFAIIPMLPRYRGVSRAFLVFEIALLLLTAVAQASMEIESMHIPVLSEMPVFSVFGLAMWLRGAVATVHAYLLQGTVHTAEQDDAKKDKRTPLWAVCCLILLSAVGVWQMVRPLIADKNLLWFIGVVSAVAAALFGYATAKNRGGKGGKKKKKKSEESTALVTTDD